MQRAAAVAAAAQAALKLISATNSSIVKGMPVKMAFSFLKTVLRAVQKDEKQGVCNERRSKPSED